MRRAVYLLVWMSLLVPVAVGYAQPNRLVPVGDRAYEYVERLQRRGHLLELNPTAFPYRQGALAEALGAIDRTALGRAEQHWVALLDAALGLEPREAGEAVVGGHFGAGTRVINSDRLDVLRPLGDTLNVFWYTDFFTAYADAGPIIAALGLRQDTYYDRDPDGLDTALRLITRSDDTYIGLHTRLASLTLGRLGHHWGVPGRDAVVLSDNARSPDQLALRLGGDRFALRALLAELDSVTDDGVFTGRTGDTFRGDPGRRRFLAAHRWDWRPGRRFVLALQESAIYSGPSAGLSLKYLNPLHPYTFVIDNVPKNDENNGAVGALVWAQHRRLTVHAQFLVDDYDFLGESGDETLSFAATASAVVAAGGFDFGTSLTAVTSRTYNAPQPEGKYLYLLRGLGTQFSDYVHAALFADVYLDGLAPGLRLTPRLDVLAQGERRRPSDPFPDTRESVDNLLDGTVERTVRPSLTLDFQPRTWWWIRLDGGLNFTDQAGHVEGAATTRVVGQATAGLRLSLDRAVRLSL